LLGWQKHSPSGKNQMPERSDDPKNYKRRPLSNREGFRRLDKSLEKIELGDRAREKICEVCQRRCRAWRIVPATAGQPIIGKQGAAIAGGGRFLVCCDGGPEGCAEMLIRAGVPAEELRQRIARARLKKLGVVVS
jgi:hypothetical protein